MVQFSEAENLNFQAYSKHVHFIIYSVSFRNICVVLKTVSSALVLIPHSVTISLSVCNAECVKASKNLWEIVM